MKDTLCSYYTKSEDIISYMIGGLDVSDNDKILEPSAGTGAFIDRILETGHSMKINAYDLDQRAISILRKKYKGNDSVVVKKTDTLLDGDLDFFQSTGGYYDKNIGNPPYGAWQDSEKRDLLKKKYPGQYVKETYSLFLFRCILVLKMGGRLSFIIPDTYMFLNLHKKLRKTLLTETKIREIILFPTKFFRGVNFGYAKLSIITLDRCRENEALDNTVRIVSGFRSMAELALLENEEKLPAHLSEYKMTQSSILDDERHRFIFSSNNFANNLIRTAAKLGDVANIS